MPFDHLQYVQQGYSSTYGQPYPADQVAQPYGQQQYGTPQVRRLLQSHSDIVCTNPLIATSESAIMLHHNRVLRHGSRNSGDLGLLKIA